MELTVKNLKIGSKIILGRYGGPLNDNPQPIVWLKATENCDLISESVLEYLCYDAKESGAYVRGNPTYTLSNIFQFVNSEQFEWFAYTHDNDKPPVRIRTEARAYYDSHRGFLYNFEDYEVSSLVNTTYSLGDEQVSSCVRLPSVDEIIGENKFKIFASARGVRAHPSAELVERKYAANDITTTLQYCTFWCRGINTNRADLITRQGAAGTEFPYRFGGLRPVCTLNPQTKLTEIDGEYRLLPFDVFTDIERDFSILSYAIDGGM